LKALQKLSRHGNSTTVTIKGPMLRALGWLPGRYVLVELTEHGTVSVRPVTEGDITALQSAPRPTDPAQGALL
jgi:antitoxin component of MazEF toxin-antitoxin module